MFHLILHVDKSSQVETPFFQYGHLVTWRIVSTLGEETHDYGKFIESLQAKAESRANTPGSHSGLWRHFATTPSERRIFLKTAPTAHHFSSIFVEKHTCTKAQFFFEQKNAQKISWHFLFKKEATFFHSVSNMKQQKCQLSWIQKFGSVEKWNNGLLVLLKKANWFQICLLEFRAAGTVEVPGGLKNGVKMVMDGWGCPDVWTWLHQSVPLQNMSKQITKNSHIPRWSF